MYGYQILLCIFIVFSFKLLFIFYFLNKQRWISIIIIFEYFYINK